MVCAVGEWVEQSVRAKGGVGASGGDDGDDGGHCKW